MYRLILSGLLLLAVTSTAGAMAPSGTNDAKTTSLDVMSPFAEQRQMIEKRLADGKTYSEISASERSTVSEALGRISAALESAGSIEALSPDLKARVFNDQEVVNTILTRAGEDSRLVCERVEKIGSHRKITACMTAGERRRSAEASKDTLRKVQSVTPTLSGGG